MNISALARSLGISRQMVYKLANQGMPTDSTESALAWRKTHVNPFRSKTGRIGGNTGVEYKPTKVNGTVNENEFDIGDMVHQVKGTQLDLDSTDADTLFKNARALKEKAMALQAAAEHFKFIGELIEQDYVNRVIFERARQFRDGLMGYSRRIAPEIAGNTNIVEIESVLNRDFRSLLQDFARLPVIEE